MSIPVRHSGRIAFAALIVIALIAALLGVRLFALAQAPPTAIDTATAPTFTIGPIEGLTTTWHWAPPATSIPLGTLATFFQPAPPDTTVIWTGADEMARDDQGSTAVCWLVLPGITTVQVQLIPADGGEALTSRSLLNVVDVPIEQITVSAIDVRVDPVTIDEDLPQDEINEQTMGYFFGPSIAALRDLGDGQYRTSVNRKVHMSVEVDPPGFAPLIEWRFDDQPIHAPPVGDGGSFVIDPAVGMGTSEQWWFPDIGNYLIEVGPRLNPEQIEIETYSVKITSHTSGQDIIEEGEPIVFIAETDPAGYENDITWLSSTLYGTAEPILGEGPIFIAEFNDTWGPWPMDPDVPFQWLGVKADNTAFNQDQKPLCFNRTDVATKGLGPWTASVADFDGDEILDLAVSNRLSPFLSIILGNGDGTFGVPSCVPIPLHNKHMRADVDLDGDGIRDIAVAIVGTSKEPSTVIAIALGNGDGTFAPFSTVQVEDRPTSVSAADFNSDGNEDLVVTNRESDSVSILLGDGNGTFGDAISVGVGGGPRFSDVGDFNKDGIPDIATANFYTDNVSVLLGNGDGSFELVGDFDVGRSPGSVAIGDFDEDGTEDLAVGNCGCVTDFPDETVSILRGNGDGTFVLTETLLVEVGPSSVDIGDLNADGHQDLAVANWGTLDVPGNTVSVLLGNGNGTFRLAQNFEVGDHPTSVAIRDLNIDGKQDLAVANNGSDTVSILIQRTCP